MRRFYEEHGIKLDPVYTGTDPKPQYIYPTKSRQRPETIARTNNKTPRRQDVLHDAVLISGKNSAATQTCTVRTPHSCIPPQARCCMGCIKTRGRGS